MDTVLRAGLTALALAAVTGVSIYARRRPNRAKERPDFVRMPAVVAVIGWTILVVGLLMCLAAFTTGDGDDTTAMRIASVAMVLGGAFLAYIYRNFRVAFRRDEVEFRTIFGVERVIRYNQIATYRLYSNNGAPMVSLRAVDGTKLSLNTHTYDATPLLAAITFYENEGYWPH